MQVPFSIKREYYIMRPRNTCTTMHLVSSRSCVDATSLRVCWCTTIVTVGIKNTHARRTHFFLFHAQLLTHPTSNSYFGFNRRNKYSSCNHASRSGIPTLLRSRVCLWQGMSLYACSWIRRQRCIMWRVRTRHVRGLRSLKSRLRHLFGKGKRKRFMRTLPDNVSAWMVQRGYARKVWKGASQSL